MTTMPQPNDPTRSFTATYDGWNRLIRLADGSTLVSEYAYDGSKRRIVQKSYTAGSLTEARHMYYTSTWQSIEERLGTSPDAADAERQFVWGLRYIDDCVLRDRDTDTDGDLDERLYALQDGNWNVTAIVDDAAAVQERYAYAAYGQPMFLTPLFSERAASSYAWESLYCGYRYESATGVFHVRNRVYHPVVGSWVQRDPIGLTGGWNLYGYVGNQVFVAVDPSGNQREKTETPMPEDPFGSDPVEKSEPDPGIHISCGISAGESTFLPSYRFRLPSPLCGGISIVIGQCRPLTDFNLFFPLFPTFRKGCNLANPRAAVRQAWNQLANHVLSASCSIRGECDKKSDANIYCLTPASL